MELARTILRVTVGLLFIGHGTQKLFGWFGGGGLDKTGDGFESMAVTTQSSAVGPKPSGARCSLPGASLRSRWDR